jgi:type IV secretory pathway VirB6-like protein
MKAETLDVFKIFEKAHGEDQAKKIITYFENADTISIEREVSGKTNALATKEDVLATREDLTKEIGNVKTEIANVKADMIKWMFIFWIGQIAATFGFIILYLKK